MGIQLLPPNINLSGVAFTVARREAGAKAEGIHYALAAIKNVGRESMISVVSERQENGSYKGIWNFVNRLDPRQVNKRQMENLARAGVFDELNPNRAQMLAGAEILLRVAGRAANERKSDQLRFFGGDETVADAPPPPLPVTPAWSQLDRLANEGLAIGFYLSAHPLESYPTLLARKSMVDYAELSARADQGGSQFRIAATIEEISERKSAKGNTYAFIRLSDRTGIFEVTLFGDDLASCREILIKGNSIVMTVNVRDDGERRRFVASQIVDIEQASLKVATGIRVFLDNTVPLNNLSSLLNEQNKGRGQVTFMLEVEDIEQEVEVTLPGGFIITPQVRGALKAIPGVLDVHEV